MDFYLLQRPPRHDDQIPLDVTDEHPGCITVNCPSCGVRGVLPSNRTGRLPVEVVVQSAVYLDDIEQAFTTLLVSQKFRDAVTGAALTGIDFYPPIGFKVKRNTPQYHEVLHKARDEFRFQVLHITGRGGSIAQESGMMLKKSCEECGWKEWTLAEEGFRIDESQWDGSDFFFVQEGPFFMSERAVRVLRSADLSNFGAMRAEDFRPPAIKRKGSLAGP